MRSDDTILCKEILLSCTFCLQLYHLSTMRVDSNVR
jgi:hypothetical protein